MAIFFYFWGAAVRKWLVVAQLSLLSLLIQSCATVDQFGSRIYDGNVNSQSALNEETLLNILRASKGQTPNFVGISQITGSQTETLTTGLPTINLGPHQTAAQQIYSITNNLGSAVNGGYQASPLISTSFQELMLFPINFKQLALLLGSHPRELVFHATIDGLVLSRAGRQVLYRNNPTANENGRYEPPDKNADGSVIDCRAVLADDRFEWNTDQMFNHPRNCSYSKFVRWLRLYLDFRGSLLSSPRLENAPQVRPQVQIQIL